MVSRNPAIEKGTVDTSTGGGTSRDTAPLTEVLGVMLGRQNVEWGELGQRLSELSLDEASALVTLIHGQVTAIRGMDQRMANTGGGDLIVRETSGQRAAGAHTDTDTGGSITTSELMVRFGEQNPNAAELMKRGEIRAAIAGEFPLVTEIGQTVGNLTWADLEIKPRIAQGFRSHGLLEVEPGDEEHSPKLMVAGRTVTSLDATAVGVAAQVAVGVLMSPFASPIYWNVEVEDGAVPPLVHDTIRRMNGASAAAVVSGMTGAIDEVAWCAQRAREEGSVAGMVERVKVAARDALDARDYLARGEPLKIIDRIDRGRLLRTGAGLHREALETMSTLLGVCGHELNDETRQKLARLGECFVVPPMELANLTVVNDQHE